MKRSLLLGAVSAMAMIASAQAADLGGAKETVYTPPPYNWAGFYVGVNGGYAWNQGGVSVSPGGILFTQLRRGRWSLVRMGK